MSWIQFCLLTLVLSLSMYQGGQAAQQVDIYTYDSLPPYAYRDRDRNLVGVYVDIVRIIDVNMPDYEININVVPWSRAKKLAQQGEAFAILPPYFHAHDWLTETEPQRPYLWPYSLPILLQTDVVICRDDITLPSPDDYPQGFSGLSFSIMRGDGRAGDEFYALASSKAIRLSEHDNTSHAILFLLYGRVDCLVASRLPFYWYLDQLEQVKNYTSKGQRITVDFAGTVVTVREVATISKNFGYLGYTDVNSEKNFPFKKDFSIKFDIELYKLQQSGVIDRMIERLTNK